MPLLHPDTPQGQRLSAWEQASQLAQAAGLPRPPEIRLPPLPDLSGGGCDQGLLEAAVGQAAAGALRLMIATPEFQAQVQGQLQTQRQQALAHFDTLERQRQDLLGQLAALTAQGSALDATRGALGHARAVLGLEGVPIAEGLLASIREACPAVGHFLGFAEAGVTEAGKAQAGVEAALAALTGKLTQITDLQGASAALLEQIDDQITALPALLEAATGGP